MLVVKCSLPCIAHFFGICSRKIFAPHLVGSENDFFMRHLSNVLFLFTIYVSIGLRSIRFQKALHPLFHTFLRKFAYASEIFFFTSNANHPLIPCLGKIWSSTTTKIKKVYSCAQVRLCRLLPELGQLPSERKQSRQIGTSGVGFSALRFLSYLTVEKYRFPR